MSHEEEAWTVLNAVTTDLPTNSKAESEQHLEEILTAISHEIQNVITDPSSGFISQFIHKKFWSFSKKQ